MDVRVTKLACEQFQNKCQLGLLDRLASRTHKYSVRPTAARLSRLIAPDYQY